MQPLLVKAGLWGLLLWSGVALAQAPAASVGIEQMEDMAATGHADAFANMVETALGATGRFRVVERPQLLRLLHPPVPPRSRRSRARIAPAPVGPPIDYLVQGSITAIGVRARTNIGTSLLGGLLSGIRGQGGDTHCSNQEATIGVDIRILNARTREISQVLRVTETQRAAATCGGEAEIDMPRLLRAAANRVAAELVTSIYPIQIAAIQADGTIIFNHGAGTVQPDAAYAVYVRGQPIRDPATQQIIGNEETLLGYVRVREVSARMSRASPIGSLTPQIGAILRPATAQDVRVHERNERRQRRRRR